MNAPTPGFDTWYQALRSYPPYPWQSRLALQVASGQWPRALNLPTGAGKTSVLDIWVWAHVCGLSNIPQRVYWCVDRRLVVDSVALQADFLQQALPSLQTTTLRGGLGNLEDLGLVDPSRPAIIPTTIDQLGSRLLFRAYGSSHWVTPLHAGLAGQDALIVLDEAHLSEPFATTLKTLERQHRNTLGLPWHCLFLTATPRQAGDFNLDDDDYAHPGLQHRLASPKPTRLVECKLEERVAVLVNEATALREAGAAVVAVVVNQVATARAVFHDLQEKGDACLLTGRIRETDRSAILTEYLPRLLAGSRANGREPLFVVATQTIEVGADLDFDALVSECAALSALRQRFGRLNRTGELATAPGVIVHCKEDKDDPVYGSDSKTAWRWLQARSGKGKRRQAIDFSAQAMQNAEWPEETRPDFPLFGDADLAVLAQTSQARRVDVSPWLHGNTRRSEVAVVWRADLGKNTDDWPEIVRTIPPLTRETLTLPLWELQRWLQERHRNAFIGLWDGDELTLGTGADTVLRPGMTVILPADYGGCDRWGWAPGDTTPVSDQGDSERRRRLHPALQVEAVEWLSTYYEMETPLDEREWLAQLGISPSGSWQFIDYPGGLLLHLGAPEPEQVAGVTVPLGMHLRGTARHARALLPPHLPEYLADAVVRAALWHDIGKRDTRFQQMLGAQGRPPLAKSITRTREQARQARQLSGLPTGWRHEIASTAWVRDSELIRYLIATHHGRGRCWLPAQPDQALWQQAGGFDWPDLHARLSATFDPWGLALLETLVRLADWAESREESEKPWSNNR